MKPLLSAALFFAIIGTAMAGPVLSNGKWRLADAATDACLASCTSQSESCKRVCPTTFSPPCISACDSQAQTCRQNCRNK
ncbi:hypothetical protein SAMN05443247_05667 [Bradyrhizobium erythrophlei]|jgi:hypothetical protein|nr:hypothetical protein SAMN05443247_05667 [Bradyrhizobium erythrophlei]